jgi:hypothetical protein
VLFPATNGLSYWRRFSVCPHSELKSDAVPDYVYFGAMIAAFPVDNHMSCLRECLSNAKCRSINFYEPMTYQQRGNCELLSETQYDNPRAMRPFHNAVYYERIHCRVDEFDLPTGEWAILSGRSRCVFHFSPAVKDSSAREIS